VDVVTRLASVVIGRNEGERFERCLDSLLGRAEPVVYVDSGSTDGSVGYALEKGASVVELDDSIPFTAARARNAGFERVQEVDPNAELVMFVDGDCEVADEWWASAIGFMDRHAEYGVVCGRRRERHPEASVYNYLCDVEWDTPVGDAESCGGDALMRTDAFASIGGFDPNLIAGEEPELCLRLRQAGWKIRRLDVEMTLHDAAMTRFSQWWKRATRAGHAYAEVGTLHREASARARRNKTLKTLVWSLGVPFAALGGASATGGASLGLFLLYPLNVLRLAWRMNQKGASHPFRLGAFLMLSKVPETVGIARYHLGRLTGNRSTLIEYKSR
jgi:GT2 family glycosyltransferase